MESARVLHEAVRDNCIQFEAHGARRQAAENWLELLCSAGRLASNPLIDSRARIVNRHVNLGHPATLQCLNHRHVHQCSIGDHRDHGLDIPGCNLLYCLEKNGLVQERFASRERDLATPLPLEGEKERSEAPPFGGRSLASPLLVAEEAAVIALRRKAYTRLSVGVSAAPGTDTAILVDRHALIRHSVSVGCHGMEPPSATYKQPNDRFSSPISILPEGALATRPRRPCHTVSCSHFRIRQPCNDPPPALPGTPNLHQVSKVAARPTKEAHPL